MADKEATRKISEAILVCRTPDVCKTPMGSSMVPVPYQIISKFETAAKTATTVNFTGEPAFNMGSYLPTVIGDEAGVGGGMKSGTHKGKCVPVTHSTTVRVEKQWLVRHDDLFQMNGTGSGNTIGKVIYDKVVSKETLSFALDVIPVVSTIKGAGQLITGKDLVTGEPVNRWIEAAGLVASLIPGGKGAVSGGKAVVKGALKEGGEKLLKEGGEKLVKEGAEKLVKEGGEKLAKESGERLAKESVEKAEKEIAEKATQKTAQKTTEEAVEKTGKKAAKKGSKDGSKVTNKGKKGPCDDLKKGNGSGQHRGGAHSETSKPVNDGKDSHHMPAKESYKGKLDPNDGPAIQMDPKDHAKTLSNGSGNLAYNYRKMLAGLIADGKWRDAMAMDIRDARNIARMGGDPKKYNQAIKEMLAYFNCLGKNGLLK
ncbi:DUF4150 domain-containing protein [candidate division KSB1 bacterium]|nr:DUF4150 domain-containing protein [candidate division KSB1 bacterium]MCE7942480.1 DUF4150 domain-containing protein [Chlorobi bacterium CHB1]